MIIQVFKCNNFHENCYVVSFDDKEGFIVDCGAISVKERMSIAQYISDNGIAVKACLQTHMHYDHSFGLPFVHKTYEITSRCHKAEIHNYKHKEWWVHCLRVLASIHEGKPLFERMPTINTDLADGVVLYIGGSEIQVIETPGHSPGGLCFYLPKEKVLFTGDTIFSNSVGNVRDRDANWEILMRSVKTLLNLIPEEVTFYPSHGECATIGQFSISFNTKYLNGLACQ